MVEHYCVAGELSPEMMVKSRKQEQKIVSNASVSLKIHNWHWDWDQNRTHARTSDKNFTFYSFYFDEHASGIEHANDTDISARKKQLFFTKNWTSASVTSETSKK